MKENAEAFLFRLDTKLARRLLPEVKRVTPSTTLHNALRVNVAGRRVSIGVPHYWAPYYHDDRGPVTPKTARWLVWFTDPQDDPRIQGGYPVRRADVRRLTKEQWLFGLAVNAKRREDANGGPFQPYMVYVRAVRARKGKMFFTVGLSDAGRIARPIVAREFDKWVRSQVKSEKLTATVRL